LERPIRRALVSTHDKKGVVALCRRLRDAGIDILSSGGTAALLEREEVAVVRVADYTGAPEILDGRVKTLHPRIHAGILAVRSNPDHMSEIKRQEIEPIDLVIVNLYPFRETAAAPDASVESVIEMIDIGGPSLIRAAAKNFADVAVVVDPADYDEIATHVREQGSLPAEARRRLAAKAFAHTAAYDAAIRDYLAAKDTAKAPDDSIFAASIAPSFVKAQDLRYGENPHQRAAFYREGDTTGASLATAHQLQGKELSFNNLLDFDAALTLAADLKDDACVIVKHGNPSGVGLGHDATLAFRRALECDPVSAFGGVIAFNRPVDEAAAVAMCEAFYEGVIAPEIDPSAREILAKKKKLRVLKVGDLAKHERRGFDLRRIDGGLLVQDWDTGGDSVRCGKVVGGREPTEEEWRALEFAWTIVRHVKSNAIVFARQDRTVGIGAGQMSRVDSVRLGIEKARSPLEGAVMASDAFFPFADGVEVAAEAGVTAVVQPGGSIRDPEVTEAAERHGIAMVLTGRRHFRH
jgi:phosphoribosylaminoimidazolecarboxamide formyltransferase/IMP cyclohydrolase